MTSQIELQTLARKCGGYSLSRAVKSCLKTGGSPSGVEGEISQELQRSQHGDGQMRVPFWALRNDATRTLTAGTTTDGEELVGEDIHGVTDALRPNSLVRRFGVRVLSGLVGDQRFPRVSTATSVAWPGNEVTTAYVTSEPQFSETSLSPLPLGASTDVSKQLIVQTGGGIESILRNDVSASISEALDTALIQGSGSGEPTGITNTGSILTSTITTAAAPAKAELFEFIEDVEGANALTGNLGWVTTPALKSYLMQTLVDSGVAGTFWDMSNSSVLGYPAASNPNIDAGTICFGDWGHTVVCAWTPGIDVVVDSFTGAKNRTVTLTTTLLTNSALLHPSAFSVNAAP